MTKLLNGGFCDWSNLGIQLQEHEQLLSHIACVKKWIECELRLKKKVVNIKSIKI